LTGRGDDLSNAANGNRKLGKEVMAMALPSLWRWNRGERTVARRDDHPFLSLQRDMNQAFEDFWRGFDLPAPFEDRWGSFTPRVDVEQTEGEVRVTAELPVSTRSTATSA
jgi:hypothetical protein